MRRRLMICTICHKEISSGKTFHACDDWLHWRMFICNVCLDKAPMQRSAHEQCYECLEHLTLDEMADLSKQLNSRLIALDNAIRGFEHAHAKLFAALPITTDPN